MLKSLLSVKPNDRMSDIGLLVLRLGVMVPLFIKHGLEKIDPAELRRNGSDLP